MKLAGKVAIVTGGTRGIGNAIVEKFIEEGATVIVGGSRQETADKAIARLKESYPNASIEGVGIDLSSGDAVKAVVSHVKEAYGKIDILVNNAGITTTQSILEITDEEFDKTMQVDLYGVLRMTREVSKVMVEQKSGSIINTSSIVGLYGSVHQPAYSCAKAGVIGLTKACARELGRYNVRVNAVAPGVVGTDMVKENVTDAMLEGLKRMIPMGRMADPKELASVYAYLASEDASYTNGAVFSVDGGLVM